MSDVADPATATTDGRSGATWNSRKCLNEACGEMNHVKRLTCKVCGTALPVKPKLDRPVAAKSPLTRRTVIAVNKKARAEQAPPADPAPSHQPTEPADDPPAVLSDITVTSASFMPPIVPPESPPAAIAPEPERPLGRHIALEECRTTVDGTMIVIPKDHVLDDLPMIRALLKERMPIVPVSEAVAGVVCCPNCRHVFKPAA